MPERDLLDAASQAVGIDRSEIAAEMASSGKSWKWLMANRYEVAERVVAAHRDGAWVAIADCAVAGICVSRSGLRDVLKGKGIARTRTLVLFINSDWLVRPASSP